MKQAAKYPGSDFVREIFSSLDIGDHTARFRKYWPNERYEKSAAIERLLLRIIPIPISVQEAMHNKDIQKQIMDLK